MDNLTIPEPTPLAIAEGATYTEIAQAVYHLLFDERPTHWRFTVENGLVLARNGDGADYLLDGPPARTILDLPPCAECGQPAPITLPCGAHICLACYELYLDDCAACDGAAPWCTFSLYEHADPRDVGAMTPYGAE